MILGGLGLLSGQLAAQDAPYLRKGNIEGNVFVGASHGLDSWRWSAGGNVAMAVTRNWMPYAEYSYFPGIGRKDAGGTHFSLPASDVHAGVHYRIPFGQKAFVPYLVAGAGVIHWSATTYQVTIPVPGQQPILHLNPVSSRSDFAVNFGAGIRYYVFGESSGFRTEIKMYKPTGSFTDPFIKASVGFFYQFK